MNVPTTPPRKRVDAAERSLAELAERQLFVRLKLLKPHAEAELMLAVGQRHLVFIGEDIPEDIQIRSVVASRQTQPASRDSRPCCLRPPPRRSANRPQNSSRSAAGVPGVGSPEEIICRARVAESRRVHERRREEVRLFEAQHLLAQTRQIGAVRIERRGGVVVRRRQWCRPPRAYPSGRRCDPRAPCRNPPGWSAAGC